ncbi:hypothetical protein MRX96_024564 [Rhipicephalus microplus]
MAAPSWPKVSLHCASIERAAGVVPRVLPRRAPLHLRLRGFIICRSPRFIFPFDPLRILLDPLKQAHWLTMPVSALKRPVQSRGANVFVISALLLRVLNGIFVVRTRVRIGLPLLPAAFFSDSWLTKRVQRGSDTSLFRNCSGMTPVLREHPALHWDTAHLEGS